MGGFAESTMLFAVKPRKLTLSLCGRFSDVTSILPVVAYLTITHIMVAPLHHQVHAALRCTPRFARLLLFSYSLERL